MQASDNINSLLDRMDFACYSDYCRMVIVVWWNI